jgi:hypothetical protein
MHVVSVSRNIEAPLPVVWNTLSDFGKIHLFHPGVEASPIVNGIHCGLGAQRVCHFYDGNTVKETVVAFEEQHLLEVELAEYSIPLKCGRFRMEVSPLSEARTRTTITVRFIAKMGLFGWVLGKVLMEYLMRRDAGRVLKGLEDHLTTGQAVGRGGQLLKS